MSVDLDSIDFDEDSYRRSWHRCASRTKQRAFSSGDDDERRLMLDWLFDRPTEELVAIVADCFALMSEHGV